MRSRVARDILPCICASLIACTTVQAQESAASAEAPADGRQALNEIVVTGSRIPVSINDEIMPVTVLDSSDLARGGFDSLSKILQTLPMSASSVLNTNVNNDGDGSARVDLRSLQPKRTLVLLNGNRLPNGGIGGDNSVDLNSIPAAMIDRVEVLTTGASAIYGADAVAGVVNLITRSDLNGIDMAAEHSQTYHDDGAISTLTLNAGHELFGGQWMMGGEYVDQRPVSDSARGYSAVPLTIDDANGDKELNGSGSLPEGLFFVPGGNALGLPQGVYTHVSGVAGRTAADYRLAQDADEYNFAPYNYLQTPNQRSSAWLFGTQPLTSSVSLHVEGLFNHRYSSQVIAPTPFNTDLDPAPILADGTPGIPASNYYNPFGEDLSLRRRFVELGNRVYQQRVDMNRELASLGIQEGLWKIAPAVSFSRSNATETDIGAIPGQLLATAVGPSGPDAQGQIVCGSPNASGIVPASAIIPGCVPIDLFGGVGSLTQPQLASLSKTLVDHGTDSERIASIDARGPWGAVPGGPIQWATGAEYRHDEGSYIFDPNRGGGAVGSGGQEDIPEESISAHEVYLEMRAPLVRQHPLVEALDLSAGIRHSDFSSFGGHFTWQAGLRWQPFESWALRTNYARVFRAPSLQELYSSGSVGVDLEVDPCGNNPTPIQRVHCAANGVPGGQYVQSFNPANVFNVFQGGNPNLGPESGYSFDTGVDIRPQDLPSFRASLDYYEINLNGYINDPGTADILQQCADGGRADICSLIRRAADGSIVSVSTIPRNFGNEVVSGIDISASAIADRSVGRFTLSMQASYLARHDTQLFPGGDTIREAGTYSTYSAALPRWRSLAHVYFDRGPWHFSYSNQWIGGYTECNFVLFQVDEYCRRVDDVFYQDVEAALTIRNSLTLRLGVNNLTNQQPPFLNFGNDANTDTSTYRLLGRTFFVAVRYKLY
jgi:iron complex outermembrane receptor protein